jgi:type IV fimbrial biogenesis protein FimT
MHQLRRRADAARRVPAGGFTLIELLITMGIFATMLAIGIPNASNWLLTNRARSASEFYADGFSTARRQAISSNAASRIVLSPNVNTGQLDWQVDLCFPQPGTPCNAASGSWSTPAVTAAGDPLGSAGYLSVYRAADALPPAEVLLPSTLPVGSSEVYFSALGWVDTTDPLRLTRLRLDPAAKYAKEVPVVALVVTLAGMVSKCDPTLPSTDNRACPP